MQYIYPPLINITDTPKEKNIKDCKIRTVESRYKKKEYTKEVYDLKMYNIEHNIKEKTPERSPEVAPLTDKDGYLVDELGVQILDEDGKPIKIKEDIKEEITEEIKLK